ncbi:PspA/IM30 family protein [Apibacter muscae]|uniref:PspA/IM30 family protein n=1 Tax=Apibacter muscae TaxID=2509004 RepID=A0A563DBL0_9FLAO|nr:PspA/IM30 family protein [Apibacter muscae]TWP27708.1 PspA/IM30 family protein [Apibacter muscae]
MSNIFKRLLRIGSAEIHSVIDKMEEPVRMTEQGIREMKADLENSLEALAKIKALAIRTNNDISKKNKDAEEYEAKAILLMTKAKNGDLDPQQAEKLAKEALTLKARLLSEAEILSAEKTQHDQVVDNMSNNIDILKFNINKWENELRILKARVKVSKATQEVNKQMAQVDNDGTMNMLERMRNKVADDEALAEAYGTLANKNISVDEAIDRAIGGDSLKVNQDLEEIKRKLEL